LDGIGTYGGIAVLRDGRKYIADPTSHAVWIVMPDTNRTRRWIGKAGTFYGDAPVHFAFGFDGVIFFVDNVDNVPRVLIFGSNGTLRDIWYLQAYAPDGIIAPLVATDDDGSLYVAGSNLRGILKFSAGGGLISADLGASVLNGSIPLSLTVDRFGSIFIGTQDRGVLKINQAGDLLGVIGEPYDESVPPKPGQLGKPTALVVTTDGDTLYVADSGATPQIVAFSLANNLEVNLLAGKRPQKAVTYGQEVSALITPTAFVFDYPLQARRGDSVTITLRASDPAALDVYVELLNPKGQRIAANDDANAAGLAPTDAMISEVKLTVSGMYTIRATRFGRETTRQVGSFTLRVEKNN
jgi:DNA-binding beta-propeller fold protein YncE